MGWLNWGFLHNSGSNGDGEDRTPMIELSKYQLIVPVAATLGITTEPRLHNVQKGLNVIGQLLYKTPTTDFNLRDKFQSVGTSFILFGGNLEEYLTPEDMLELRKSTWDAHMSYIPTIERSIAIYEAMGAPQPQEKKILDLGAFRIHGEIRTLDEPPIDHTEIARKLTSFVQGMRELDAVVNPSGPEPIQAAPAPATQISPRTRPF